MNVYWLEQQEADVPAGDDWLARGEVLRQSSLRFAKRRSDWRLGRWTAKRAVAARLDLSFDAEALRKIEIHAAPDGAPVLVLANKPAAMTISLSHRAGVAICAVVMSGAMLGCDLELIEPRSAPFVADYFTADEQALVARASGVDFFRLVALFWSAKESALKALRVGLRQDTRDLKVRLAGPTPACGPADWHRLHVCYGDERILCGWWRQNGNLVRTLVADPPPCQPILLNRTTILRSAR